MKNIKNILFILIILLLIIPVTKTEAYKRVIFPDSKTLQPIPKNVKPNISGNINSSTEQVAPTSNSYMENNNIPTVVMDTKTENSNSRVIFWYLMIIFVATILYLIYKSLKDKK